MARSFPNTGPPAALPRIAHRPTGLTGPHSYFFTLRLARRGDDALLRRISQLRQAMRETLKCKPFRIDAIAVLPDVIHTIWTLPVGDSDYARRIGMWKARFSRHLPPAPHCSLAQIKKGDKGIWQKRYWEHAIHDAADFARHRDLVHLSPVQAGLCAKPEDWPFSSYHRDRGPDVDFAVLEEALPPSQSTKVMTEANQLNT